MAANFLKTYLRKQEMRRCGEGQSTKKFNENEYEKTVIALIFQLCNGVCPYWTSQEIFLGSLFP